MAYTDKSKQYVYDYKAKKIKRIPLDVQLSDYELIKVAADASGETVNGYIKTAIRLRMERDGFQASGPTLGGPGEAGAGLGESSE